MNPALKALGGVEWFARIRETPVGIVSAVAWIVRSGTTVRTFGLCSRAAAAFAEPLKAKPCRACR